MKTRDKLKSFFTDHWKYMAVSASCKLGLFDQIAEREQTCEELAKNLNLVESKLEILLNALSSFDFLVKTDGRYSVTELSELLVENHPQSLKYAAMNWSGEHLNAWQHLDYSIKTGKSAFEHFYKQPYFDFLIKNTEKEAHYQKAMFEYAREDYHHLPDLIDFGIHKGLMDIGGGKGAALGFIKDKNPDLTCLLFDLPGVVENCNHPDLIKLPGDFFFEIPKLADALLLSRVLHDWDTPKARQILQNCYQALDPGSTLYLIENCKDESNEDLSLLSLNMLVMCESFERTGEEYIQLCTLAGFKFLKVIELNSLQTILIFEKQ